jgi:isoquinoline 1-oxidoreductase subunit beta
MLTRPLPATELSRRTFLKHAALTTGLVVGFVVPVSGRLALAQGAGPAPMPLSPNAFLRIGSDDSVTVLVAHSEMGQGIWTALPMLVAEELDADWSKIRVEHAPVGDVYRHPVFGIQLTGGSTSTWGEFDRYRQVGAMARTLLVEAAAARFGVRAAGCRTENGVVAAGSQRATYGQLAEDAAKLTAPANVELRKPTEWRIIGKPTRRLDTPEKIDGSARFGLDVRLPGMLTAVVAHAPVFGGTVKSVDDSRAVQIAGVRKVVRIPSGVAVVADNFFAARQGRDALTVDWDLGPHAGLDSQALRQQFQALSKQDGATAVSAGDARAALKRAAKTIDAEYFVPYLAHAPMEPLNCTVRMENGKCEIWTGTQFQTGDRDLAASITGIAPDKIELHTTFLGGGFGRRGTPLADWVGEAIHVAKAVGAPVKTVWTREDDIRGGYYRPMFLHRAKIGLDADGLPMAWDQTLVGQSIAAGTPFEPALVRNGIDGASVEGTADSPYLAAIADRRVDLHSPKTGIPVLWWRSVGNSHTGFVMESLIDEAAKAAGRDPVEYRRRLLRDHPRHLGVLNLAAEKAGWGSKLPEGRARGVAVHESFGSFVAQVAEVSVESGEIRVRRVVCAIDCGIVVNPAGVAAQMESGIAFGLSAALAGAIDFKDGRVQQSNFHDYPVLRLNQMPAVEVHIVPSTHKSGGAGEPGTPPIAPAVANAIATLTGQRLRELPLRLTT